MSPSLRNRENNQNITDQNTDFYKGLECKESNQE